MRLEGIVTKGDVRLGMAWVELVEDESFTHSLDQALLALCKDLGLPLPLWLDKNTREFVRYRQTSFFPEQYTEKVKFDQFHIKLLD